MLPKALQIILNCGGFLGLLPNYDSKKLNLVKSPWHTNVLIILQFITGFIYLTQIPVILKKSSTNVSGVVSGLSSLVILLINTYMTIGFKTYYFNKMGHLIYGLQRLERDLKVHHGIDIIEYKQNLMFFIMHLVILATFSLGIIALLGFYSITNYLILIAGLYQVYLITLLLITEYTILKQLKIYVKSINLAFDKIIVCNNTSTEVESRVWNLFKLQITVCDIIDLFNEIFGWHILVNIFNIVMAILSTVDTILNFKIEWSLQLFSNLFLWTSFLASQGVIIATICEKVTCEAKNTVVLVFRALHRYSDVPALRMKLFMLASLCTDKNPEFSAAGFFNVNFAMLFTFVNLITTYVIVIIQFSQTNTQSTLNKN